MIVAPANPLVSVSSETLPQIDAFVLFDGAVLGAGLFVGDVLGALLGAGLVVGRLARCCVAVHKVVSNIRFSRSYSHANQVIDSRV